MLMFHFIRKTNVALRELPRMSYGVFNKKFPWLLARAMNKLVFCFLCIYPNKLLPLLPSKSRYLFMTASHSLGLKEGKVNAFLNLAFHEESLDLVKNFANTQDYYLRGRIPEYDDILESIRNESFEQQNRVLRSIIQWSFWTLSHEDFYEINTKVQKYLLSLPTNGEEQIRRYLPQHTTNMGHLAMLFLYINYYRRVDPNRVIVLPKIESANDYFLSLILRHSPLKIEFEELENFSQVSPTQVDTLHYSLDVTGKYRTESDCAFYSKQDHPEFIISKDFTLSLNDAEQKKGQNILASYLGFVPSWFVILHVREPKNGDLKFSQTRDANIDTYYKVAQQVVDMGGVVIRMGNESFPKIRKNFPAWDYAHSEIRSAFMDVWLWANCERWIGTVNGAAFAPIAFSKQRILLQQWYWNSVGPKGDVGVRKKIYRENEIEIKICEPNFRVSRCMDRAYLARAGYQIIEADSEELALKLREISKGLYTDSLPFHPNANIV